jgi:hypothetical protein
METIKLELQSTKAEAVRAVIEVTKSAFKFIAIIPWLGGFLIAMTLIISLMQRKNVLDFFALLFFGVLFVSIPALTVWSAKKNFRKNPNANKTIRWTFRAKWLVNETEGAETRFMWEKLIKIEERKSGFLLFPQLRLAHWIPKNSFRNNTEIHRFRNLVRNHGITLKG